MVIVVGGGVCTRGGGRVEGVDRLSVRRVFKV